MSEFLLIALLRRSRSYSSGAFSSIGLLLLVLVAFPRCPIYVDSFRQTAVSYHKVLNNGIRISSQRRRRSFLLNDANPTDEMMNSCSMEMQPNVKNKLPIRSQQQQQQQQQINDGILNPTTNTGDIMSPTGNGTSSSSSLKMAGTNKTSNNIKSKSTRRPVSNHRNRKYSTSRELSEEEERLRREKLEAQMDAFLRGEEEEEYLWEGGSAAVLPNILLSPSDTVEISLKELRKFEDTDDDDATANQKKKYAASTTFSRFLAPLSRSERWGMSHKKDPWKEVLRSTDFLTPILLVRRLRSSPFSVLLDWETLSVTDGYSVSTTSTSTNVAFVNAALFFGEGIEPCLVQFRLKKLNGVWLIDHATISKKELFWNSHS